MFNTDFYPTPEDVIMQMLDGYDVQGKVVLEPSAGKGNIVDFMLQSGAADVIACEKEVDLKKILATKCKVISEDFLKVQGSDVSHVDFIVMNPPFSADEKHILHAWEIAPEGCKIIALCNLNTLKRGYSEYRVRLRGIVEEHGGWEDLGDCFANAERKTDVEVALIRLQKPGEAKGNEFEGFFMDEDPEEAQYNGLMPYNFVRDLVNRYVAAVKLFDEQLELAVKMNNLTSQFYSSEIAFTCTQEDKPKTRNEYKKDLQKQAWMYIFREMNMEKYTTKGLKEDLNKFVEKQQNIPFTMRNIYQMLQIVVGTHDQRMDKAILEVFDKLTQHYHDNRYNVEGWKTNSHYLMGEKFILPWMTDIDWNGSFHVRWYHNSNVEIIEDLQKALCWLTGTRYEDCVELYKFVNQTKVEGSDSELVKREWNKWYDWGFFQIKGFKKGTIHFKFKDQEVWAKFNQRVAKLKGYPLPEAIKKQAA